MFAEGRKVGAVTDKRWKAFSETRARLEEATKVLKQVRLSPQGWRSYGFVVQSDGVLRSGFEMLRHRDVTASALRDAVPELRELDVDDALLSRIDIDGTPFPRDLQLDNIEFLLLGLYAGHLTRQEADLRLFLEDESLVLDPFMDYSNVPGISEEVRERLNRVRPACVVSKIALPLVLLSW
ncbi:hypothetical protein H0H87_008502 [Tephrocybe sp. NHM501043]|nr:hypothetical protein H0H87_008502 [Tephrocybe sp. NHM501043]